MNLIEYKQFGNSENEKKINKRKLAVAVLIAALVLFILLIFIIYISSTKFRNFMDKYILMKSLSEDNAPYITIESDDNIYTYAYHDYIAVLKNNELNLYNSSGKNVETIQINISTPIYSTKGKYLAIAEKSQQKIYLLKDKKIIWDTQVEGQISRLCVNENGYVSIIITGTSYKSVIVTYDSNGTEIFRTYLSTSLATDVDISNDNKYISFCELDISGTLIDYKIKTVSIEEAKQNPQNSIINTYNIPANELITNLSYHQKNELICIGDSKIYRLKDGKIEELSNIDSDNITFAGIQLEKSYYKIIEQMQGINNQHSTLEIYNTNNKKSSVYTINGIAKEVYSQNGVIAVNLGSEVYFISENGWLIKKYTSSQEIKEIVVADNIAGIVYRNKIQFINL